MASIISAGTATNTAVSITGDTTGALALATNNGTTALTIDTSQKVGIGTTSPVYPLDVNGATRSSDIIAGGSTFTYDGSLRARNSTNNTQVLFNSSGNSYLVQGNLGLGTASPAVHLDVVSPTNGATAWAWFHGNTGGATPSASINSGIMLGGNYSAGNSESNIMWGTGYNSATQHLLFSTWNNSTSTVTERMRINSSGNVILGSNTSTTANNVLNLWSPTSTLNGIYMQKNAQVEVQMGFKASTNTDFYIGTGSTTMGTYGVYLANTGNSWISVSDVRQKDIIEPIENALTKVTTLRTVIGKYKHDADGVRRSFLIAQDVQAVFPEAVKVQEDEEALLGLSYTDVIPLLVASIKELKAINDAQAVEIAALKAKVGA